MSDATEKTADIKSDQNTDVSDATEENAATAILDLKKEIAGKYIDELKAQKESGLTGLIIGDGDALKDYLVSEGIADRAWKNIKGGFMDKFFSTLDKKSFTIDGVTYKSIFNYLKPMKAKIDAAKTTEQLTTLKGTIGTKVVTTPTTDVVKPDGTTGGSAPLTVAATGAAVGTAVESLTTSLEYIYPFTQKEIVTQWFSAAHHGIDIGAKESTQIYAVCEGTVVEVGDNTTNAYYKDYGNHIVLKDKNGNYSLYGHLQEVPALKKNDTVKAGDFIGKVGHTGYCIPAGISGAHLHFEVRTGGTTGPDDATAENPLIAFPDLLKDDRIITPVTKKTTT